MTASCDPPCSLTCSITGGAHHTPESLRAAALAEIECPACPFPDDRPECCHDGELS